MATVLNVFPADGATGVFLRDVITVEFDTIMDEGSINEGTFVVEGPKRIFTTGPDHKLEVHDKYTAPIITDAAYKAFVSGLYFYETLSTPSRTKVRFVPNQALFANTTYTCYVVGTSGSSDDETVIQTKSVGTAVETLTGTGTAVIDGSYYGEADDTLTITIVRSGGRSEAFYKWSLASLGVDSRSEVVRYNSRIKTADLDIEIEFAKGDYVAGDSWVIPLSAPTKLDTVYTWSFTTGQEQMETPPSTLSTPVTEPPDDYTAAATDFFADYGSTFASGYVGVSSSTQYIVINVNGELDTDTVNTTYIKIVGQLINYPFTETDIPISVSSTYNSETDITSVTIWL